MNFIPSSTNQIVSIEEGLQIINAANVFFHMPVEELDTKLAECMSTNGEFVLSGDLGRLVAKCQ